MTLIYEILFGVWLALAIRRYILAKRRDAQTGRFTQQALAPAPPRKKIQRRVSRRLYDRVRYLRTWSCMRRSLPFFLKFRVGHTERPIRRPRSAPAHSSHPQARAA